MAAEGTTHYLSLKVMRVSRPELASAWQPFYSSSPSFSAHSSAHILSLQGAKPLAGHPKTLRDLTHSSELLTLPSAFGSIQLGETFSSCLSVNNESQSDIEVVQVKVEMQTITAKVTLAEIDESKARQTLRAGDTLESLVHHEIKELGQHVLGCTVTYRLPPNARPIPGATEDPNDPLAVTFRKFYKFMVTNPLSVKTKVHAPRSPSATLSLSERDKIFLEVHIQNLTANPMHFERMQFEPVEGWDVTDANYIPASSDSPESIFTGALALMQPQDTRQYIYILKPTSTTLVPPPLTPGSIIPLGRLDISWRSPFGEPGRLLTSMLTRKIPFPPMPPQPPASAVPSHLKRNTLPGVPGSPTGHVSRPSTPSISSRPISPPPSQLPGSPRLARPGSISQIVSQRPTSPLLPQVQQSTTHALLAGADLDVNLVIKDIPRDEVKVNKPFVLDCQLVISSPQPLKDTATRKLAFAVQHLFVSKPPPPLPVNANPPLVSLQQATPQSPTSSSAGNFTPRAVSSSGFSTPSSRTSTTAAGSSFNYALAHQKILNASFQPQTAPGTPTTATITLTDEPLPPSGRSGGEPVIPPPYFDPATTLTEAVKASLASIHAMGASALFLDPIEIKTGDFGTPFNPVVQDFQLTYVPTRVGFCRVGGLRVLLVQDKLGTDSSEGQQPPPTTAVTRTHTLKEYDIIAEVWVST